MNNKGDFYGSLQRMRQKSSTLGYPQINPVDDESDVGQEVSAFAYLNQDQTTSAKEFIKEEQAQAQEQEQEPQWYDHIFGFIDETAAKFGAGFVKGWEGILDIGANALGWLTDLFGGDGKVFTDWAKQDIGTALAEWTKTYANFTPWGIVKNIANGNYGNQEYWSEMGEGAKDILDSGFFASTDLENYRNDADKYYGFYDQYDTGVGEFIGGLAGSFGEMLPSIMIGNAVGGAGAVKSLGEAGAKLTKGISMGAFGLAAAGNSAEEALNEGASSGQALGYGLVKGGIEVASEIVVGKALNGIASKVGLDKALGKFGNNVNGWKFGTEVFKNATKKEIAIEIGKSMFEEGAEEVFSDLLSPLAESIYKGSDAFKGKNGKFIYIDQDYWKDVGLSFASGAVMGGISNSVQTSTTINKIGLEGWKIMNSIESIESNQKEFNKLIKEGKLESDAIKQLEIESAQSVNKDIIEKLNAFKESNPVKYRNLIKLLVEGRSAIDEWEQSEKEVQDYYGASYRQRYAWNLDSETNQKLNTKFETTIVSKDAFNNAQSFMEATGEELTQKQIESFPDEANAVTINGRAYISDTSADQFNSLYLHENISHNFLDKDIDSRNVLEKEIKSTEAGKKLWDSIESQVKEAYGELASSEESIKSETIAHIIQNNANSTQFFSSLSNAGLNKLQRGLKKLLTKNSGDIQKSNNSIINTINETIGNILDTRAKEVKYTNKIVAKLIKAMDGKGEKTADAMSFNIRTWNEKTIRDNGMLKSHKEIFEEKWIELNGEESWKQEGSKISAMLDKFANFFEQQQEIYKYLKEFQNVRPMYNEATGELVLSARVKNGEYIFNFDFSTICEKRESLSKLFALMSDQKINFDKNGFDKNRQAILKNLIAEAGLDTACSVCFVEGKRTQVNRWSTKLIKAMENAYRVHNINPNNLPDIYEATNLTKEVDVISGFKDADTDEKIKKLEERATKVAFQVEGEAVNTVKALDEIVERYKESLNGKMARPSQAFVKKLTNAKTNESRLSLIIDKMINDYIDSGKPLYKLTASSLLDSRVLAWVKKNNPDLFSIFTTIYGQANPKLTMPYAPYTGNVAIDYIFDKTDIQDRVKEVGGVRANSFSDFSIEKLMDYLQYHADLAMRGLTAQAYTKNLDYALFFGQTGEKINLSIVPEVDKDAVAYFKKQKLNPKDYSGLDQYGNYVFASESVDFEKACELQERKGYKGNVGTCLVGVSKFQILKALADNRIKMIIPYHSSGMAKHIKIVYDLNQHEDFTNYQNTMHLEKGKMKKLDSDPFLSVFYDAYHKNGGDSKKAADAYLKYCKDNNLIPRFALEWDANLSFEENLKKEKNYIPSHENYYKVLIDFTSDGGNGVNVEQKAINFDFLDGKNFDDIFEKDIKRALKEKEEKLDNFKNHSQEVVDSFKDILKGKKPEYKIEKEDTISKQAKADSDIIRKRLQVTIKENDELITSDYNPIKASLDLNAKKKDRYKPRDVVTNAFKEIGDIVKEKLSSTQGGRLVVRYPSNLQSLINTAFSGINEVKQLETQTNKILKALKEGVIEAKASDGKYYAAYTIGEMLDQFDMTKEIEDTIRGIIVHSKDAEATYIKKADIALDKLEVKTKEFADRTATIRRIQKIRDNYKNIEKARLELTDDALSHDGIMALYSIFDIKSSDRGFSAKGFAERVNQAIALYDDTRTFAHGQTWNEMYPNIPFEPEVRQTLIDLYESLSLETEREYTYYKGTSNEFTKTLTIAGSLSAESMDLMDKFASQIEHLAGAAYKRARVDNETKAELTVESLQKSLYGKRKNIISKLWRQYKRGFAPAYVVIREILGGNSPLADLVTNDFQKAYNSEMLYRGAFYEDINKKLKEFGLLKDIETKKITLNGVKIGLDEALYLWNTLQVEDNKLAMFGSGVKYRTDGGGLRELYDMGSDTTKIEEELSSKLTENEKKYAKYLLDLMNTKLKEEYIEWYKTRFGYHNHRNEIGIVGDNSYWTLFREVSFEGSKEKMMRSGDAMFKRALRRRANNNAIVLGGATSTVTTYVEQLAREKYTKPIYRDYISIKNIKVGNTNVVKLLNELDTADQNYLNTTIDSMIGIKKGNVNKARFEKLTSRFAVAKLGFNLGTMLKQFMSIYTSNIPIKKSFKAMFQKFFNKTAQTEFKALIEDIGGLKYRQSEDVALLSNAGVNTSKNSLDRALDFVSKISMIGITKSDFFTVSVGVYSLMQIAQDQYGYKIGTEQNKKFVKDNWVDFELSQIGNSALSLNAVSRGDYDSLVRAIFGFMQGANRAALGSFINKINLWNRNRKLDGKAIKERFDNAEARKKEFEGKDFDISKLNEAELSEYKDILIEYNKAKTDYDDYTRFEVAGGKGIPMHIASGLVAQALLVTFINLLMKWLKGKKDLGDADPMEETQNFALSLFTGWVPFVNSITEIFQGYDVTVPSVSVLNEIATICTNITAGNWQQSMKNIALLIGDATGIPFQNLYDYLIGTISMFNPEVAIRSNSWLYNSSQASMTKSLNESIEKGNDKKATAILSVLIDNYKISTDNDIKGELTDLYLKGYNCLPKTIPSSYTNDKGEEVEFTAVEKESFKEYYELVNDEIQSLMQSGSYDSLDDEYKGKTIKKLYDAYYDYAKSKVLGTTPTSKIGIVLAHTQGKINISRYLPYSMKIAQIEANKTQSRKDLVIKYINKLHSLKKQEKLLLLWLNGYGLTNENKSLLGNYLIRNGMTKKAVKEILSQ